MQRSKNSVSYNYTNSKRKKKKKSLIGTFFKTVLSIVFVFIVAAGGIAFAYSKLGTPPNKTDPTQADGTTTTKPTSNNNSFFDSIMGRGIKLNVAVFGVDNDETRTDVMFVVHFDSKAKKLGIISLPRDTRVYPTDEIKTYIKSQDRKYDNPCKLNAIHAYVGKDKGPEYAVKQMEDLLNISIDHYVKVNLEGFRQIVDAVGGIDIEVPQDMKYTDPYQDLYINLKAGYQHLDGSQAEQLVRFRYYDTGNGDIDRIGVQQEFLKTLAQKVMDTDTIKNNLGEYINTYYKYVTTDIGLVDAVKYARYIGDIDMNNVNMLTLPGGGETIDGVSFYIPDPSQIQEVVDDIFYSTPVDPNAPVKSSKDKTIEVANGGSLQGMAGKTQDFLVGEGYNISTISTYNGDRTSYTRIIVKQSGIGEDLKQYFLEGTKVLVKPELVASNTDIKIIIGTDEEEIPAVKEMESQTPTDDTDSSDTINSNTSGSSRKRSNTNTN